MIISAEEVRNYVDSDEPASMLEAKLRALESLIRRFTNNNFQVRAIRSRSAIMDGKILKPPPYLKQGGGGGGPVIFGGGFGRGSFGGGGGFSGGSFGGGMGGSGGAGSRF